MCCENKLRREGVIWEFGEDSQHGNLSSCGGGQKYGFFSPCVFCFCGFVWTWTIEFVMPVIFPVEEAVDFEMIQDFPALINVDGLQGYLTETQMAEEITQGIRTNLSANVYSDIELADMRMEHPGKRIIRIILDRIFG